MNIIRNRKIRAIVTAVGGRAVGAQILASLRLASKQYYIIATDICAFSPGLYEADAAYILPGAKDAQYIPSLLRFAKEIKADVILPGSQPEALIIAKHREIFLKNGIIPIVNPYNLLKQCFDKHAMNQILGKLKILIPKTVSITSIRDVKTFRFPIIIKPSEDSTGSRHVHIVKDTEELNDFFETLSMKKVKFLAQEYIGSEDEEYTVGIVAGWDGRIIDSIVMRRYLVGFSRGEERVIRGQSYVLSTGISQGFFVNQPDVKEYAEYVCKKIGARGPVNIQCRRSKKKIYIFEVHPRFSGSASLRALMGFNEPHVLIQEALGLKRYAAIPHKLGYAVMRKFANVAVDIKKYNKFKQQEQ